MIFLSQRDSRWAATNLGVSKLTVGRYGCTTTAVSMLSDYFKCYVSPYQLAHNAANYTTDGLIIWKNLSFTKMAFECRLYGFNKAAIDESLKYPNRAVILQVNDGAHWVVAYSKKWVRSGYTVIDPWTGKKCDVLKVYKNITGSAHFIAK